MNKPRKTRSDKGTSVPMTTIVREPMDCKTISELIKESGWPEQRGIRVIDHIPDISLPQQMLIRRFTMEDQSTGKCTQRDLNLSMQQAFEMTDWEDYEYDIVANLHVGESYAKSGLFIERTR